MRTTRQRAAALVGGDINAPDRPVYLVVLRGRFGGGRFLPGKLADFTVDVRSGRLLDVGTSNRLPPLLPLGRVHSFRLRDCARTRAGRRLVSRSRRRPAPLREGEPSSGGQMRRTPKTFAFLL